MAIDGRASMAGVEPVCSATPSKPSEAMAGVLFGDENLQVLRIDGKGCGVVAARRFEVGAVVLEETPLVRVSKDTQATAARHDGAAALMQRVYAAASTGAFDPAVPDTWPPEVVDCLDQVMDIQAEMTYEEQSPDVQRRWMALSQFVPLPQGGSPQDQTEELTSKSPGRIIRTNAFDDAEGFANLYELLSRMNHRCAANAIRVAGANHAVKVVAAEAIDKGEEICISYLDEPHANAPRAQESPAPVCGHATCRSPLKPPLRQVPCSSPWQICLRLNFQCPT